MITNSFISALDCDAPTIDLLGGKGYSLVRLIKAGFSVPDGFCLTTHAYQVFVEVNHLEEKIQTALDHYGDLDIDRAVLEIQSSFRAGRMPNEISIAIENGYRDIGDSLSAIAVRSSAIAEDSPEFSFAGQLDTLLNICGQENLLDSVVTCWSSLWNRRAIEYRRRAGLDSNTIGMAVVVQLMIPAKVSGVVFTANPASGDRDEVMVEACYGLGEGLVGGTITPDHFIVDRNNMEVKTIRVSRKEKMAVANSDHGITQIPVDDSLREQACLSTGEIVQLAQAGLKIEQFYNGQPQDIEWAIDAGNVSILQSRPITNLPAPPIPDQWLLPATVKKLIRRQIVENMPEPLSPLFEDLYLHKSLDESIDAFMSDLGAPFDINELIGRPFFVCVNGYAYCRADFSISAKMLLQIPKMVLWSLMNLRSLMGQSVSRWRDEGLPQYLELIEQWRSKPVEEMSSQSLLQGIEALAKADALYWFHVSMVMGMAKITDGMLHRFLTLASRKRTLSSGMFLQGFPSQTLKGQQQLASIAATINESDGLRDLLATINPDTFSQVIANHPDGHSLLEAIDHYRQRYGHQIVNLDFAVPTQGEELLPVLLNMAHASNSHPNRSKERRKTMERDRKTLEQEVVTLFGPVRRWLFKKLHSWARYYGPHREEALFHIGAAWPTLRKMVLELGSRQVADGRLAQAPDAFYLNWQELQQVCEDELKGSAAADLSQQVRARMQLQQSQKKLHPPGMVPPASAWKVGPFTLSVWETQKRNAENSNVMKGFAVSPGVVTGTACIIMSSADFGEMRHDSILVCPTTTPGWTPLFSQARGLVTDIGGILAHGSIIAREYGIPAVMGTGNATKKIRDGQKITIDGNLGTVTLHE